MVKVAIDIDGTLAAWPSILGPLSHAMNTAGWDVVLLTGHSCSDPAQADRAGLLDARHRQAEPFRAGFRDIVVCVGKNSGEVAEQKAAYCRDNGIDLFIDDSRNYCEAVRRVSPKTLVLWVHP